MLEEEKTSNKFISFPYPVPGECYESSFDKELCIHNI